MKNVIAYLRVSTEGQVGDDKFGLDFQRNLITKYCEEHGYTILEWFEDCISGAKANRPAFDQIVYGEVTNPPYEAVVVAKSDRIARDVMLYYAYKYELSKKHISLISVTEDFDQMGVMAPVLESFTAALAQVERYNINLRTMGGRREKASRGGYSGGKAPMGYDISDGRLVVNEKEAATVRRIFELRAQGMAFRGISDVLNEEGHYTRGGGKFAPSTVKGILDNQKTYQGWYKYGKNGEWVKGQHEAILRVEE